MGAHHLLVNEIVSRQALLHLQRSVGNHATVAFLNARLVQRFKGSDEMTALNPVDEHGGFGGQIPESEATLITRVLETAGEVLAKAKGEQREVLVFYGVGTGNPMKAVGNPSGPGASTEQIEEQGAPGFLGVAARQGMVVIALHFNPGLNEKVETDETGLRCTVPAQYPLSAQTTGYGKAVEERLKNIADQADKLVVMNAVTDADFLGILNLLDWKTGSHNQAYIKSYAETQLLETHAPGVRNRLGSKTFAHKPKRLTSMNDVFLEE